MQYLHKPNISFWDIYAFFYDSVRLLLPYQELLSRTVRALKFKSRRQLVMLDAGCGSGNLIELLSRSANFELHGLDLSHAMLRRAQKKVGRVSLLVRANLGETLPYRDNAFDGVTALNSLYAARSPLLTLKEFERVLKFGGLAVIANPKTNPRIADIFRHHFREALRLGLRGCTIEARTIVALPLFAITIALNFFIVKRRAKQRTFHFLDEKQLQQLLKEAGLRTLAVSSAYAETDVFAVASKALTYRDTAGEEVTVEVVRDPDDERALYRLRYDVYCKEWQMLDPKNYPDKEERDAWDEYSLHLVAKIKGEVVGTLRLIFDSPLGFLMEQSFKLPPLDRERTVEHSRAIVREDYRRRDIHMIMEEAAYRWQKENDCTICVGAAVKVVRDSLVSRGWQVIGEPGDYHGTTATPIIFHLSQK